eukprot:2177030-Pleurochrysis_carterae.AAC.1
MRLRPRRDQPPPRLAPRSGRARLHVLLLGGHGGLVRDLHVAAGLETPDPPLLGAAHRRLARARVEQRQVAKVGRRLGRIDHVRVHGIVASRREEDLSAHA